MKIYDVEISGVVHLKKAQVIGLANARSLLLVYM